LTKQALAVEASCTVLSQKDINQLIVKGTKTTTILNIPVFTNRMFIWWMTQLPHQSLKMS